MNGPCGWEHPDAPVYYERFNRRHARYRAANRALVRHAALAPGMRVLDFGAGTGRTAEAALPWIGAEGRVVCVEPSPGMRAAGERRLADPRLKWVAHLPLRAARFHRILCGAGIWQVAHPAGLFERFARLLRPGGALAFNIPSAYLGIADEPGGGADPFLHQLPALLAEGRTLPPPVEFPPVPSAEEFASLLQASGLRPVPWTSRHRLTGRAYRDWLKIPALTDRLLAGLAPRERAARIDAVFRRVDAASWRWEQWSGWTAWKEPHARFPG